MAFSGQVMRHYLFHSDVQGTSKIKSGVSERWFYPRWAFVLLTIDAFFQIYQFSKIPVFCLRQSFESLVRFRLLQYPNNNLIQSEYLSSRDLLPQSHEPNSGPGYESTWLHQLWVVTTNITGKVKASNSNSAPLSQRIWTPVRFEPRSISGSLFEPTLANTDHLQNCFCFAGFNKYYIWNFKFIPNCKIIQWVHGEEISKLFYLVLNWQCSLNNQSPLLIEHSDIRITLFMKSIVLWSVWSREKVIDILCRTGRL